MTYNDDDECWHDIEGHLDQFIENARRLLQEYPEKRHDQRNDLNDIPGQTLATAAKFIGEIMAGEESLDRAVASIDAIAEEHEQPNASDMTRASAHGLRQAAGAMRHLRRDGVEDVPKICSQNDIVTILNDLEPIDYNELSVAVAVAPADMKFDYQKQAMIEEKSWYPFSLGEIIVIGEDGREAFGQGRHPGKWGIQFEYFKDLRDAMKRRAELLGEP